MLPVYRKSMYFMVYVHQKAQALNNPERSISQDYIGLITDDAEKAEMFLRKLKRDVCGVYSNGRIERTITAKIQEIEYGGFDNMDSTLGYNKIS